MKLHGKLRTEGVLHGKIRPAAVLKGTISKNIVGTDYVGDYTVIPKVTEQALCTKGKHMVDDVLIKEIPFYEVGNTSGGNTVFIGNEV